MLKMYCDICGEDCTREFIHVRYTNKEIFSNKITDNYKLVTSSSGRNFLNNSSYNICTECANTIDEVMDNMKRSRDKQGL